MGIRELMEGEVAPSDEDVAFVSCGKRDVAFYKNRGYPDHYEIYVMKFEAMKGSEVTEVGVTLTLAEYPTKESAIEQAYKVLQAYEMVPVRMLDMQHLVHKSL